MAPPSGGLDSEIEQLSMVFCKYFFHFSWGLFRRQSKRRLISSLLASSPFLCFRGLYGVSEWGLLTPASFREGLTAETSEQAGGQGSLLSDGCFLLACIDHRQSPPTVSHISAKWITDKSVGDHCCSGLTLTMRPEYSQVTSAWLLHWELMSNTTSPKKDAHCL